MQTDVLIEVIKLGASVVTTVGVVFTGVIGLMALRKSSSNSQVLTEIKKSTDGLTSSRIEAEKKLGDANAEIQRGAGRDEERTKAEQKAANISEGQHTAQVPSLAEAKPVEVKVVEAAPVEVTKSVPLRLEKEDEIKP